MAMISINGVELPVLIDSLVITEEMVGTSQRNASGFMLRDNRGSKWKLAFTIAPKSLEEAMLYEALLTGRGDYWPLYPDHFSSKGQAITGTGYWDDADATNPTGYDGDWLIKADPTPFTCIIPTPYRDLQDVAGVFGARAGKNGNTVLWVENDGGAGGGDYRVVAAAYRYSDASPLVKRQRYGTTDRPWSAAALGSPESYNGRCTFACGTGSLTISGPTTGSDIRVSNILWLPRAFQQAELDTLLTAVTEAGGLGFPPLPRLGVVTDLLPYDLLAGTWDDDPANHRAIICIGDVTSAPVVPVFRNGALDKTGLQMQVELVEV